MNKFIRIGALVSMLAGAILFVGCGSSAEKNAEGTWISYEGYTVNSIRTHVDEPIYEVNVKSRNNAKTIYTADIAVYNYQYTTPNQQPQIVSNEMTPNGKVVHMNYAVALKKVLSATDLVGNVDKDSNNTILLDFPKVPVAQRSIVYDPKTDTIKFMNHTFKRASEDNSLATLAEKFKKDVQTASEQYLKEVGDAANPKTTFVVKYTFNDDILKTK